mmetsp:Transcript_2227/g.8206  ORF Transcript_2227/g.8206 Transcript_2227/m.8206 type:complete len:108 (+) Transcript_2227:1311-1634(+)
MPERRTKQIWRHSDQMLSITSEATTSTEEEDTADADAATEVVAVEATGEEVDTEVAQEEAGLASSERIPQTHVPSRLHAMEDIWEDMWAKNQFEHTMILFQDTSLRL